MNPQDGGSACLRLPRVTVVSTRAVSIAVRADRYKAWHSLAPSLVYIRSMNHAARASPTAAASSTHLGGERGPESGCCVIEAASMRNAVHFHRPIVPDPALAPIEGGIGAPQKLVRLDGEIPEADQHRPIPLGQ